LTGERSPAMAGLHSDLPAAGRQKTSGFAMTQSDNNSHKAFIPNELL